MLWEWGFPHTHWQKATAFARWQEPFTWISSSISPMAHLPSKSHGQSCPEARCTLELLFGRVSRCCSSRLWGCGRFILVVVSRLMDLLAQRFLNKSFREDGSKLWAITLLSWKTGVDIMRRIVSSIHLPSGAVWRLVLSLMPMCCFAWFACTVCHRRVGSITQQAPWVEATKVFWCDCVCFVQTGSGALGSLCFNNYSEAWLSYLVEFAYLVGQWSWTIYDTEVFAQWQFK